MVLKNWQVSRYQLWAHLIYKKGQVSTARLAWTSCLPQLYPGRAGVEKQLLGVTAQAKLRHTSTRKRNHTEHRHKQRLHFTNLHSKS